MIRYSPVFAKERNKFVLAYEDAATGTWLNAILLGQEYETNLGHDLGFQYEYEVVVLNEISAVQAEIDEYKVFIIAGPIYDEVIEKVGDERSIG